MGIKLLYLTDYCILGLIGIQKFQKSKSRSMSTNCALGAYLKISRAPTLFHSVHLGVCDKKLAVLKWYRRSQAFLRTTGTQGNVQVLASYNVSQSHRILCFTRRSTCQHKRLNDTNMYVIYELRRHLVTSHETILHWNRTE